MKKDKEFLLNTLGENSLALANIAHKILHDDASTTSHFMCDFYDKFSSIENAVEELVARGYIRSRNENDCRESKSVDKSWLQETLKMMYEEDNGAPEGQKEPTPAKLQIKIVFHEAGGVSVPLYKDESRLYKFENPEYVMNILRDRINAEHRKRGVPPPAIIKFHVGSEMMLAIDAPLEITSPNTVRMEIPQSRYDVLPSEGEIEPKPTNTDQVKEVRPLNYCVNILYTEKLWYMLAPMGRWIRIVDQENAFKLYSDKYETNKMIDSKVFTIDLHVKPVITQEETAIIDPLNWPAPIEETPEPCTPQDEPSNTITVHCLFNDEKQEYQFSSLIEGKWYPFARANQDRIRQIIYDQTQFAPLVPGKKYEIKLWESTFLEFGEICLMYKDQNPKEQPAKAPETLYNRSLDFITEILLPTNIAKPEMLLWNDRRFYWDTERELYREGTLYVVPVLDPVAV